MEEEEQGRPGEGEGAEGEGGRLQVEVGEGVEEEAVELHQVVVEVEGHRRHLGLLQPDVEKKRKSQYCMASK